MTAIYNAGQLATIIKKLAQMDMEELGPDDDTQNSYIFQFMNIVMLKMARMAYNVEFSDAKTISVDGYVTFQLNGVDISNLFEPLSLLDSDENEVTKRTSYSAPKGWYRESNNLGVHVRGLTSGTYSLKYIRYPNLVTLTTDTVEIPPSGYDALIKDVIALIKLAPNSYAGSEFAGGLAKESYGEVTQGAMSARGTGTPPNTRDTMTARGG